MKPTEDHIEGLKRLLNDVRNFAVSTPLFILFHNKLSSTQYLSLSLFVFAVFIRERTVQLKNGPTGPVTLKICTGPIRSGPVPLNGAVMWTT